MAVLRRDKYSQHSKKQGALFSDFLNSLEFNPDTKDLYRNIDLFSIEQSLKNLIFTDRGERLFQPEVGCDIRRQLFENYTPDTAEMMKTYIESTIKNFEPRVRYLDSIIQPYEGENGILVTIYFSTIIRPGQTESISVLLTRVR